MESGFLRFAVRRLGTALLLLLGVTVMTFALTNIVPSNPVIAALGEAAAADPVIAQSYREQHHLDDPLPLRYVDYMRDLAHGDLGTSIRTNSSVRENLSEYAPASLELGLLAAMMALVAGITLGTISALFHNRFPDHLIRVVSLAGVSMPIFWLALVAFYVFSYRLGWFEGSGRLDPGMVAPPRVTGAYTVDALLAAQWSVLGSALSHLLLPACVLAIYAISFLTRFTRSAVLDVLSQDYVRTARAKGLRSTSIALRHILRAALVPIVTVSGVMFGALLSGTVFVESIFGFGGLGQYAYLSATNLDLPAVMGITLCIAFLYITINFVVDVLYGIIDPRIRLA